MQKEKKSWQAICSETNKKLANYGGKPGELAHMANINYHAARRFIKNGIHNRNQNTEKICSFFKIDIEETEKMQPELLGQLQKLLESVWDGSAPHAELISELIKSTKSFRVKKRK